MANRNPKSPKSWISNLYYPNLKSWPSLLFPNNHSVTSSNKNHQIRHHQLLECWGSLLPGDEWWESHLTKYNSKMFLVGHLWSAATDRPTHMTATVPGLLPWDLVPNRLMLNRISKSPKWNQISNHSNENRILNGQIESLEAIQSRFKSNRDWDLPITGSITAWQPQSHLSRWHSVCWR